MTEKSTTKPAKRRIGRPSASEKGDRRRALLDSALELFAGKGFANVELREIAANAGVTVGLIRHYFGSKDDLIDEATDHVVTRLQSVFERMLSDVEAKNAEEFIEILNQRAYDIILPEYDLLMFLKHMVIELPEKSIPVFQTYYQMLQAELAGLEKTSTINPQINKSSMTFLLMFIQLGPVLLSKQIEAILGKSVRDPETVRLRIDTNAHILKYGLVERDVRTKG